MQVWNDAERGAKPAIIAALMSSTHIFLVAGEISGDSHGAAMLAELPSVLDGVRLSGLGGPKMHALAPDIEDWLEDAAVLGLWEVLKNYRYFKNKMEETVARIHSTEPDGVVLIDYPGFNLRLAKRLRADGYTGKLIYYISPQVWAWKKGRIRIMAELLDVMICIFPFEKELYESSGLRTEFCGHPLVDSLAPVLAEPIEREAGLVALMPGSRLREIDALFPAMLEAAQLMRADRADLRFITSAATDTLADRLRQLAGEHGLADQVEVLSGESQRIMRRAEVGVVASGTATLEAAILGLPYCLTYKVAWVTAFAARRLMKIAYLGIVNVIADREVVRELLQEQATDESIASELQRLLSDAEYRATLEKDLKAVAESLGGGGAHSNAAKYVAEALV